MEVNQEQKEFSRYCERCKTNVSEKHGYGRFEVTRAKADKAAAKKVAKHRRLKSFGRKAVAAAPPVPAALLAPTAPPTPAAPAAGAGHQALAEPG